MEANLLQQSGNADDPEYISNTLYRHFKAVGRRFPVNVETETMPPTSTGPSTTSTTTTTITFAKQQTDIDEISAALPALATKHAALLTRHKELTNLLSTSASSTNSTAPSFPSTTTSSTPPTVADELAEVDAEVEAVALQQRGRLMMARECEEANRRMLEVVSAEFLTRGEREVLGSLRVKLARILEEFG